MSSTADAKHLEGDGFKARVQRVGGYLAGMIMPNIAAFIAWGLITALFIPTGWIPNETLAALPAGPVDLAYVDANKDGYIDYFEAIVPRLRAGGLLLVDNTLWSGRVADPSADDTNSVAIRAFNDHVVADDRVDAVIVSIGDGLTVCVKN